MSSFYFRRSIFGLAAVRCDRVGACITQEKNDPKYIAAFDLQS